MDFKTDDLDHPIYIKSFEFNPELNSNEITCIISQNLITKKNTKTTENSNTNSQNSNTIETEEQNQLVIKKINKPCVILFDTIIEDLENNSENYINLVLKHKPEITIIATGADRLALDYKELEPFYKYELPFEVMNSMSACRTYNLLAGEHRKVAVVFKSL